MHGFIDASCIQLQIKLYAIYEVHSQKLELQLGGFFFLKIVDFFNSIVDFSANCTFKQSSDSGPYKC